MSLNTAHANGGVLIYSGEVILLFSNNVTLEFQGTNAPEMKGSKHGRHYLTTHRMIFNSTNGKDQLQSFSFPFVTLSEVEIEQPVFGANYIKGKVKAQENGNWTGEAKFKLHFKSGGAIDFGQAMLRAAQLAKNRAPPQYATMWDAPPPYVSPQGQWQAAPPPAYAPPSAAYYGWALPTQAFPMAPPANSVYMSDSPPPYPGVTGASAAPNGVPPAAGPAGPSAPVGGWVPPPGPNAYYNPNNPQYAYVPPAYNEPPPNYFSDAANKKSQ